MTPMIFAIYSPGFFSGYRTSSIPVSVMGC
jgi:hypothetical protein